MRWRHTAHQRGVAHVRHELLVADPWACADERVADADAAVIVSDLARLLRGFPRYLRPVVALAADGHGVTAIADILGIPVGTASNRRRRVRDLQAERARPLEATMSFDFCDPDYRAELTFPGRPVTRRVSPRDIERYLDASGYTSVLSAERGWPREIPFVWYPPRWPDPRAPPVGIEPRFERGPRLCSQPLAEVIQAIAHNQGRTRLVIVSTLVFCPSFVQ